MNINKDKIIGTAEECARVLKKTGTQTLCGAKNIMCIAVEEVKKAGLYTVIGKRYYNANKSNPEASFADLCNAVGASQENIEKLREKILLFKNK